MPAHRDPRRAQPRLEARLAARGRAGDGLLDTDAAERRPIGVATVLRSLGRRNPGTGGLVHEIVPHPTDLPAALTALLDRAPTTWRATAWRRSS